MMHSCTVSSQPEAVAPPSRPALPRTRPSDPALLKNEELRLAQALHGNQPKASKDLAMHQVPASIACHQGAAHTVARHLDVHNPHIASTWQIRHPNVSATRNADQLHFRSACVIQSSGPHLTAATRRGHHEACRLASGGTSRSHEARGRLGAEDSGECRHVCVCEAKVRLRCAVPLRCHLIGFEGALL